ncbi:hypothetical protein [Shewanella sp. UCD-KL12]|nr:hypothetical protein [Shewanella sp. UCD-KL12]
MPRNVGNISGLDLEACTPLSSRAASQFIEASNSFMPHYYFQAIQQTS